MNNPSYVYLATPDGDETYIFTVGFYQPGGGWYPVSDHSKEEDAAKDVHYLNGGSAELAKVKAILSSTETELRGADLLIAKLKAQISTLEYKDKLIGELVEALEARGTWSRPHDAALVERAKEALQRTL